MTTINPLQAHMDEMDVEAVLQNMTDEDRKQFNRVPDRCNYAANLLEELADVYERSAAEIRSLFRSGTANERLFINLCWDSQARNLHNAEQLLWQICDASWYNRNDALCNLNAGLAVQDDVIRFVQHNGKTIIKCPYLPTTPKGSFTLTEDMLMSKLSHTKEKQQYASAHVSFIHIFSTTSAEIPKDVGNFYYRRTIDLLAVFFGFSDAAQLYSMSMSALFSDTIEKGTYIIIEEKPEPASTMEILEHHFSQKS